MVLGRVGLEGGFGVIDAKMCLSLEFSRAEVCSLT